MWLLSFKFSFVGVYVLHIAPIHVISEFYVTEISMVMSSFMPQSSHLIFLQQARKDISKIEDPFDAPTYNIPEKPVTFTEGASYSVIILAGLGIAQQQHMLFSKNLFSNQKSKIQHFKLTSCIMVRTFCGITVGNQNSMVQI